MATTDDKIAALRADFLADIGGWFDRELARGTESPIERLFMAQMIAEEWGMAHPQMTWIDAFNTVRDAGIESYGSVLMCDGCAAVCASQARVAFGRSTFRVDFAFITMGRDDAEHVRDRRIKVAVELDGHDFHERTKEQASKDKRRDRVLAANGWTTLRFTGSDVFQDPLKALDEVVDHINALSYGADVATGLNESRRDNRGRWRR